MCLLGRFLHHIHMYDIEGTQQSQRRYDEKAEINNLINNFSNLVR